MGKHKRSSDQQMGMSGMYPPNMMGQMNPNMMNPNMMNPNMMNPNMMGPNPNGMMGNGGNVNMNPNGMMGQNMNPNGMMGNMPQNQPTGNPLLDMLNGVDMSQLTALLGALTGNGVDLNNISSPQSQPSQSEPSEIQDVEYEDNMVRLLNSIRSFLPLDKVGVIDKFIKMYTNGELND